DELSEGRAERGSAGTIRGGVGSGRAMGAGAGCVGALDGAGRATGAGASGMAVAGVCVSCSNVDCSVDPAGGRDEPKKPIRYCIPTTTITTTLAATSTVRTLLVLPAGGAAAAAGVRFSPRA